MDASRSKNRREVSGIPGRTWLGEVHLTG